MYIVILALVRISSSLSKSTRLRKDGCRPQTFGLGQVRSEPGFTEQGRRDQTFARTQELWVNRTGVLVLRASGSNKLSENIHKRILRGVVLLFRCRDLATVIITLPLSDSGRMAITVSNQIRRNLRSFEHLARVLTAFPGFTDLIIMNEVIAHCYFRKYFPSN